MTVPASSLDWADEGACRGRGAAEFFPVRGEEAVPPHIRDLCRSCPVYEQCLTWALHHEPLGVWAATSGRERQRMRKTLRITLNTDEVAS